MKLSIIIPAYNEEKTLKRVVDEVETALKSIDKEIIIVNDASKDETPEIINRLKKKYKNIKSFSHERNMGKGASIRTGIKNISGDLVIIQDSDLEYDPKDIIRLLNYRKMKNYEVVYGSRILNKKNRYSYYSYLLGNILLNKATNFLYNAKITDMETCYKLIPAKAIKKIKLIANGFDMEPEITAKLSLMGYKIKEIPISYYPRSKKEGKKIRWRDGVIALYTLLYWRLKHI